MAFTTLETTKFPLYAVNALDREHFLIAGGGGAAKTGVPNALVCTSVFSICFIQIFFSPWCTMLSISCLSLVQPYVINISNGTGADTFERDVLFP